MMNKESFNCGIDISKDKFDVCILPGREQKIFENNLKGVKDFVKWLSIYPVERIALEASGGYEQLVLHTLLKEQLPVVLINPKRVRYFAKAMGIAAKTDKIDALTIAQFSEKTTPHLTSLPEQTSLELKQLMNYRKHLMKACRAHQNLLETVYNPEITFSLKHLINALKRRLKKVEKSIEELVSIHPLNQLLRSAPGVGKVCSWALLAYLPELGQLNRKRIAAIVGVAPYNDDSGKRQGVRRIKGGRATLRNILYMGVMKATQPKSSDNEIKRFYNHLISLGKLPKVAQTACLRKLVVILNSMVKKGEFWRDFSPISS